MPRRNLTLRHRRSPSRKTPQIVSNPNWQWNENYILEVTHCRKTLFVFVCHKAIPPVWMKLTKYLYKNCSVHQHKRKFHVRTYAFNENLTKKSFQIRRKIVWNQPKNCLKSIERFSNFNRFVNWQPDSIAKTATKLEKATFLAMFWQIFTVAETKTVNVIYFWPVL